jgi:hypothetical protein
VRGLAILIGRASGDLGRVALARQEGRAHEDCGEKAAANRGRQRHLRLHPTGASFQIYQPEHGGYNDCHAFSAT